MITSMVTFLVIIAVYLAARYVFKQAKKGGCVGCGNCSATCCHCLTKKNKNQAINYKDYI